MPKSKVDVSLLTKELMINGEVATADVIIALMKQMETRRKPNKDNFFYYIEGLGQLQFTPEERLTQERLDELKRIGIPVEYPVVD